MTDPDVAPSFRLGYVPGVMPDKWVRTWAERVPDLPLDLLPVPAADATGVLHTGAVHAALLRLPVDREALHAIPLYTETTVVLVPKDHVASAVDEVLVADLADEVLLHPLDDTLDWTGPPGRPARHRPASTGDAVELVAAGVGLLVLPLSLARLHHRKDLISRPVPDAPQSQVALSWLTDQTTDAVEQFIGIVRGRTVNSTRGRQPAAAEQPEERRAPAARRRTPAKAPTGRRGKPRRRS